MGVSLGMEKSGGFCYPLEEGIILKIRKMETIPATYWMVIIGVVTFMVCLVLYYIAMLIKESRDVVRDSRSIIKNADAIMKQTTLIVDDVQDTVSVLKGTIMSINETVLIPIRKIGTTVTIVGDFLDGLKRK